MASTAYAAPAASSTVLTSRFASCSEQTQTAPASQLGAQHQVARVATEHSRGVLAIFALHTHLVRLLPAFRLLHHAALYDVATRAAAVAATPLALVAARATAAAISLALPVVVVAADTRLRATIMDAGTRRARMRKMCLTCKLKTGDHRGRQRNPLAEEHRR